MESGVATFLRETLLLLVENNLLASRSFFNSSDTPTSERCFLSSENVFLNDFLILCVGDGFLSCGNRFLLFYLFFLQVETFTDVSEKNFIWQRLSSVRSDFSPSGDRY